MFAPTLSWRALLAAFGLAAACFAQPGLPAESLRDLQSSSIRERLAAQARLIARGAELRADLATALAGDHLRQRIEIEGLLDQLADPRYEVRESAERRLVEVGARAMETVRQRSQSGETLEERVRAERVLNEILLRGTEDVEREIRILAALAELPRYFEPGEDLATALRAAAGHPDPRVVAAAVRSLGRHGGAGDLERLLRLRDPETSESGVRRGALGALGGSEAMLTALAARGVDGIERLADLVALGRDAVRCGAPAYWRAVASRSPVLASLSEAVAEMGWETEATGPTFEVILEQGARVSGSLVGVGTDEVWLSGVEGAPDPVRLSTAAAGVLRRPETPQLAYDGPRVFLAQGSLLRASELKFSEDRVQFVSPLFGALELPRDALQGIAIDPTLDRLVGASFGADVVRRKTGDVLRGEVTSIGDEGCTVLVDGEEQKVPAEDLRGVLFRRKVPSGADVETYTRIDLIAGDRLIAHVGSLDATRCVAVVPEVGLVRIDTSDVTRFEFDVGSGALWGFTLVADYSENRVIELDERGRELFVLEEVYAVWDVECLDSGNLLITEFGLNRVLEFDREKRAVVWEFTDLKNPYDADRLPNGNTLIADTYNQRVIEVSPAGEIVWKHEGITPIDCDRLPNGNTLIADDNGRRVIEVDPSGRVVWKIDGLRLVKDADRLPNGNTLVTLQTKRAVLEYSPDGRVVFRIDDLEGPSDADRLPNGHTLVAESGQIREFDRTGKVVWRCEVPWAVEVNRY